MQKSSGSTSSSWINGFAYPMHEKCGISKGPLKVLRGRTFLGGGMNVQSVSFWNGPVRATYDIVGIPSSWVDSQQWPLWLPPITGVSLWNKAMPKMAKRIATWTTVAFIYLLAVQLNPACSDRLANDANWSGLSLNGAHTFLIRALQDVSTWLQT